LWFSGEEFSGGAMFETVIPMMSELEEVEVILADPAVHADQARARTLGRRHAELIPVVATYRQWLSLTEDAAAARELGDIDADMLVEADRLDAQRVEVEEKLTRLLVPRDPLDSKDVIVEVKAGEGGEESALFAGDLLRMYLRYAERMGWSTEVLEADESDLGGYKDVAVAVKARGAVEPGMAPYARLKFEGGVHRVQRVPVTESQGRIHTSACTVAVMPEADELEAVKINPAELRIDTFRASGAGGQHINKTDSAVRITHLPTGTVVECQDDRSQHRNREQAMKVLVSRIMDAREREKHQLEAQTRKSLVGTGDRSDRIRTYNFPQGRITDHRINLTLYKIDAMMDGDIDDLCNALASEHQAELLAALGDN
jgi:peptide chain release factor 1